jgi:hypothetical protein
MGLNVVVKRKLEGIYCDVGVTDLQHTKRIPVYLKNSKEKPFLTGEMV